MGFLERQNNMETKFFLYIYEIICFAVIKCPYNCHIWIYANIFFGETKQDSHELRIIQCLFCLCPRIYITDNTELRRIMIRFRITTVEQNNVEDKIIHSLLYVHISIIGFCKCKLSCKPQSSSDRGAYRRGVNKNGPCHFSTWSISPHAGAPPIC